MRKILIYLFTAFYALISFTSCVNEEETPDQVSDYDTVITHENQDYDGSFTTAKTFTVINDVAHPGEESTGFYALNATDQLIINAAIENMKAAGYTYVVPEDINVDLVVLPYSFDNTVVGAVNTWPMYDYWGDYWGGYWGDYWGWNYPYYGYPMTTYYAYDQGTVILEIADRRVETIQDDGTEKTPIIWQGILNGTETNLADNQDRITSGIHQMFVQSPYIGI